MSSHSTLASLRKLRVFVACPSDVAPEKAALLDAEFRLKDYAAREGFALEVVEWRQCVPAMGRPQQVILDQFRPDTWSVFVGILWLRFGSSSGSRRPGEPEDLTGTEEEFREAYASWRAHGRPSILLYRCTRPADPSTLDPLQLARVNQFFSECGPEGQHPGLISTFDSTLDFERQVFDHLVAIMRRMSRLPSPSCDSHEFQTAAGSLPLEFHRAAIRQRHRLLDFTAVAADQVAYKDVELKQIFVAQEATNYQAMPAALYEAPGRATRPAWPEWQRTLFRPATFPGSDFEPVAFLPRFSTQATRNVGDILRDRTQRCLVFIGGPGSGKTSLTLHQLVVWASATQVDEAAIPIRLELRHWYRRSPRGDFLAYLSEDAELLCRFPRASLQAALESGRVLLMFDGLDEIFDVESRARALEQVLRLSITFPTSRFMVTSRPVGYPSDVLRASEFRHWCLQPFNDRRIAQFVEAWCGVALRDPQDAARVKDQLEESLTVESIRELAGNPLLLTMMVTLARNHTLPRDKATLYERCAELLLDRWNPRRSLGAHPGLGDVDVDLQDKRDILRRAAWKMQSGVRPRNLREGHHVQSVGYDELVDGEGFGDDGLVSATLISRAALESEISAVLGLRGLDGARRRGVVRILIDQLRDRDLILCHLGGEEYGFIHRGFMEYFCAYDVKCRFESERELSEEALEQLFRERATAHAWREVLVLAATMISPQIADGMLWRLMASDEGEIGTTTELAAAVLRASRVAAALPRTSKALRQAATSRLRSAKGASAEGKADEIALEALAVVEPTRETRLLLTKLVGRRGNNTAGRALAVRLLGDRWRDDAARLLVERLVLSDEATLPREQAVKTLALCWRDERTRRMLEDIGRRTETTGARAEAIAVLMRVWPDERSRGVAEEVARREEDTVARVEAVQALAYGWGDAAARRVVEGVASEGASEGVRLRALHLMVERFHDDEGAALLRTIAECDRHDEVRHEALRLLSERWRNDDTRKILEREVVRDESGRMRAWYGAAGELVRQWPDERTYELLRSCVLNGAYSDARRFNVFSDVLHQRRDIAVSLAKAMALEGARIAKPTLERLLYSDEGSATLDELRAALEKSAQACELLDQASASAEKRRREESEREEEFAKRHASAHYEGRIVRKRSKSRRP
jgi:hypothetical protein